MESTIYDFKNGDYLSLFNAALLAEIIIIFLLYYTNIFGNPKTLKKWYEKYKLSAVIADVFILMIGLIIGKYIWANLNIEYNFIKFLLLILVIQIIHDILFYILFYCIISKGKNDMIDLFKDYAEEVSYKAILGDSFMIVITVIFFYFFLKLEFNHNIELCVLLMYLLPYILHTKDYEENNS